MIARFPNFEPISLNARGHINKIVSRFPPYSDFNFVSMYSYDVDENMMISQLGDNLVVRFKDYTSDKSFLSFIGDTNIDNTVHLLLGYAKSSGLGDKLHLIPQHVVELIKDPEQFRISEDRDSHDYIVLALKFSELEGDKYASKRHGINKFLRENDSRVSARKLKIDEQVTKDIVQTFHKWREESGKSKEETTNELRALERLLKKAHLFDLNSLGIYIDDILVAYSIYEIQAPYAVGHFEKALKNRSGLYDYLKHSTAVDLHQQGVKYINYEQDLGIEGLRHSKLLLHPETFLKKYTIEVK